MTQTKDKGTSNLDILKDFNETERQVKHDKALLDYARSKKRLAFLSWAALFLIVSGCLVLMVGAGSFFVKEVAENVSLLSFFVGIGSCIFLGPFGWKNYVESDRVYQKALGLNPAKIESNIFNDLFG